MKKLQPSVKNLLCGIAMASSLLYVASSVAAPTLPSLVKSPRPLHKQALIKQTVIQDAAGLITRRLSVLSFLHPDGGYVEGEEWSPRYYHIKTPVKAHKDEMWRYDLTGYSYGIGKPINFTWVGYFYELSPDGEIINGNCSDTANNNIPCSQYQGKDGFLYLKFGPIPQYFNSFTLDYQSGSTGSNRTIHTPSTAYQVILKQDETDI